MKRAQVIEKIFETYPILSKVTNQEELIKWIDEVIDESLDTMKRCLKKIKLLKMRINNVSISNCGSNE